MIKYISVIPKDSILLDGEMPETAPIKLGIKEKYSLSPLLFKILLMIPAIIIRHDKDFKYKNGKGIHYLQMI